MDEQHEACLSLWAAVIQAAVEDAIALRKRPARATKDQRDSHSWVFSDAPDVYSFTWACDMLGVDIEAVREVCRG